MEKIDRLGWAAGLSLTSYGLRIGIRCDHAEGMARLSACLPPGWRRSQRVEVERLYSLRLGGVVSGVRRFHLGYANAARIARSMDLHAALEALDADIQLYVAERARRRIFVHAGVVGWEGRAILLPGRSSSGKSTLVAALVRDGATYYSDEYAVLDAEGRIFPYARPLSIHGEDSAAPRRIPVQTLGGRAGRVPLRAALIVATEYRSGARWRPRPLPPSAAILTLLSHTVAVRREPRRAVNALREVALHARALTGVRGEAADMAVDLLRVAGA